MISIPDNLDQLLDAARAALLVYDVQVRNCSQVTAAAAITARCADAIAAARRAGMRVVFCRRLSAPKSWMGTTQLRTGMAWQRTDDPAAVRPWFPRDLIIANLHRLSYPIHMRSR